MKILMTLFIMIFITGAYIVEAPVKYTSYNLEVPFSEPQPYRQWNISYPVSDKELHCLALNVYFEARDQDPDGQFAVADVVMHRVNHSNYPDTICGVVKQGVYHTWSPDMPRKDMCHFHWYCDRLSDNPIDSDAFEAAMYVATTVLKDPDYIPVIEYALMYHADYMVPYWAGSYQKITSIGQHVFYR